jgi:hypothetical protein
MRKLHLLFLISLLLLATAVHAADEPNALVIDNFESYNETGDLQSTWTIFTGFPVTSLSDVAHAGSSSMRMDYDVGYDPFVNWVSFELADETDWSEMNTLSIYYQGQETNSADSLALQILGATNELIFQDTLPGAAAQPGWNRWEVSAGSLDGADALVIGVQASISEVPGTGTIFLDDISVSNDVHTLWLGNSSNWNDEDNWDHGVPTESTDALIPRTPEGGQMPLISGGPAVAHDLTISRGATLDLASSTLDLTGVLINKGAVISTAPIGNNEEKSFLLDGGHPGVLISTMPLSSFNSVASAAALGDTSVTVSGRTCSGIGGSIKRCYEITPSEPEPSTITFFFNQSDLGDHVCEDLSLYNYAGGEWQEVAAPGDANITHQCDLANFSVTVSGITEYSPFLLSDAEPVAINLQDLSAASPESFSPAIIAAGLLALTLLVMRRRT